jgi:hypothetical protein
MPKRISRSVTPCTLAGGSGCVEAIAAYGAIASTSDGPLDAGGGGADAPAMTCSRSASWRSAP